MSLSFRLLRRFMGPNWLVDDDDEGELVGYALELIRDAAVERVRLGVMARLPQNDPTGQTTAPPDALALMGRDRRVVRGLSESLVSYAARLIRWLDDRKACGSAFALMRKLAEYTGPGCVFRTVDTRGNWYTRADDGTESYVLKRANWEWDSHPIDLVSGKHRWARFWVVIYPPSSLWRPYPFDWGDAAGPGWGESIYTWGSTATIEEVQTVRAIVADWKPLHARCVNIVVAFDPASFDPAAAVDDAGMPNGLWEFPARNIDGVMRPARPSTARFWDGVI